MERLKKLSETLIGYSLDVKENDRVLITYESEACRDLVKYLIRDIVARKGIPFAKLVDPSIATLLSEVTTKERINALKEQDQFEVDQHDCFIRISYGKNDYESKNISVNTLNEVRKALKKSHKIKINQRRWVVLNYPTDLDAHKAGMPSYEFFDFSMNVMTFDYKEMCEYVKPLKELMERTDQVRMIGPNTDITFSIKDIPAVPCCGNSNIPDGEIFTAPVRDSVNGMITFNTPCPYQGSIYHDVSLTLKDGKIIKATCAEGNQELNKIFDSDEGARYIGEFSFGLNPFILKPMGDILYDEKIIGSIHFTPGSSYEEAYNGNESGIHWDMVWIQRKEYGGGDVYFDDVLIRKDGLFILPELEHLNYQLPHE